MTKKRKKTPVTTILIGYHQSTVLDQAPTSERTTILEEEHNFLYNSNKIKTTTSTGQEDQNSIDTLTTEKPGPDRIGERKVGSGSNPQFIISNSPKYPISNLKLT